MTNVPVKDPGVPTTLASSVVSWQASGEQVTLAFAERRLDGSDPHLLVVSRIALPVSALEALIALLSDAKARVDLARAQVAHAGMN